LIHPPLPLAKPNGRSGPEFHWRNPNPKTHKNPALNIFQKKRAPPDSRKSALRAVMGHELNLNSGPMLKTSPTTPTR
jgi:hypothetical protein